MESPNNVQLYNIKKSILQKQLFFRRPTKSISDSAKRRSRHAVVGQSRLAVAKISLI